jgi:hypothetical protein
MLSEERLSPPMARKRRLYDMKEFLVWLKQAEELALDKEWKKAVIVLINALPEEGIDHGGVEPDEARVAFRSFFATLPAWNVHQMRTYIRKLLYRPKFDKYGVFFGEENIALADLYELLVLSGSDALKPILIVPVIDSSSSVVGWTVEFAGECVHVSESLDDTMKYAREIKHEKQKIKITATILE